MQGGAVRQAPRSFLHTSREQMHSGEEDLGNGVMPARRSAAKAGIAGQLIGPGNARLIICRSRNRHTVGRPLRNSSSIYPLGVDIVVIKAAPVCPGDDCPT